MPLFVLLNRRVTRDTARDSGRRRSLVRKWFAAVTLLLAALALLGDLVAVIYSLLNGDLTLRFAAKAGLIAVVTAIVVGMVREKRSGRSSCGGNCAGCAGCCHAASCPSAQAKRK